ncbi:hypothetical protein FKW77_003941 [Venturia effusa]|uniref:Uncharacterized protein n=1 Tax=Venturia effusa TaxID=50376 RepID=A0A517LR22_9PEZI|nr:hypothetical protein FKW77_003941 [Venturia effusa]
MRCTPTLMAVAALIGYSSAAFPDDCSIATDYGYAACRGVGKGKYKYSLYTKTCCDRCRFNGEWCYLAPPGKGHPSLADFQACVTDGGKRPPFKYVLENYNAGTQITMEGDCL